jgi:hypothetical protein
VSSREISRSKRCGERTVCRGVCPRGSVGGSERKKGDEGRPDLCLESRSYIRGGVLSKIKLKVAVRGKCLSKEG